MSVSDENLLYPFSIVPRLIKMYLNRKCPCVFLFDNTRDHESYNLVRRVKYICKRYPRVMCYKIGWKSFKKYSKVFGECDYLDVSVWIELNKEVSVNNPTINQLEDIFENVHSKLTKTYHNLSLLIIEKDKKDLLRIKKNRAKSYAKIKNERMEMMSKVSDIILKTNNSILPIKEISQKHLSLENVRNEQKVFNKTNEVLFLKLNAKSKLLNIERPNFSLNLQIHDSDTTKLMTNPIINVKNDSSNTDVTKNYTLPTYNKNENSQNNIEPKMLKIRENTCLFTSPISQFFTKINPIIPEKDKLNPQKPFKNINNNYCNFKPSKRKTTRPIKYQHKRNTDSYQE